MNANDLASVKIPRLAPLLAAVTSTLTMALPVTPLQAESVVLTNEHADVGSGYEEGSWDLHVHDESNGAEYEPNEALLFIGPAGKTSRPAGASWEFLGNEAGADLWVLPQ